jgi:hypothetical protein
MLIRAIPVELAVKEEYRDLMAVRDVVNFGIATPIQKVLNHLNVTIPEVGKKGWSKTVGSAGASTTITLADGPAPTAAAGVQRLRALGQSVRGRLLLVEDRAAPARGQPSARRRTPIEAAWRVLDGPAYYHHCLRSLERRATGSRPASTPPRGSGWSTRCCHCSRYASPALHRDIERYASMLAQALLAIDSLDEVPAALARTRPDVLTPPARRRAEMTEQRGAPRGPSQAADPASCRR